MGRANFAALNANYPARGRWVFSLNTLVSEGERVVSDVSVTDSVVKARAISFFTVTNTQISSITEVWPEPYEPPAQVARGGWRGLKCDMSDSVTIRSFNPDTDFSAYVDFLNTCSELAGAETKTTEQEQRDHAELFTIDLRKDRFLAEIEGNVVGFLDIWRLATNPKALMSVQVHPELRRKGIGSKLLEAGKEHGRTIGAVSIDGYAQSEQTAKRRFLEHHGFVVAGNYTAMEVTLDKPLPQVDLEGHTLKTYAELHLSEDEKLELIFTATQEFWGVLFGHGFSENEAVGKQRLRDLALKDVPENAIYFLFDGGKYIGHDRVSFAEEAGVKTGYMSVPALHPEYHTPALAKNFALVGLEYLQAQGCTHFNFNAWGESEATLEAFKELGFKVTMFELGYQLEL